jgi:peptidase M23-like protein
MHNKFKIFILFYLVIGSQLFSQNYLWPTNASNFLTSSFCEYRPGHYHSAIDIKTWNKEGYPIYAIEDGSVYKIRVSPFGYGKVIYLKLKDGNFAIYAHLQRFSKSLDKTIRQKQLANQKYSLNWYPKNMPVKKGDIIGYTGSTGIGVPHLHFEIRNPKEQPLNPLQFYPQVKDEIRPRLQKIAILPQDANSFVNKSYLPQVFDLTYIKDGIYVIKDPIKANGNLGLAIKGYDQADGVHNKFAFYQTTLELEGNEVFQIIYDKMDFASTGYIDTEIYYPIRQKSKEVFHKLYVEPFNILPFYTNFEKSSDRIQINDSPVSFTITVKDFHGNTSKIIGEIQPEENDQILVKQKFVKNDWVYLKINLDSFNFLSFSSSNNLQDWQQVNYFEILDRKSENPGHSLFTKIKIADSTAKFLRIEAKSLNETDIFKTINIAAIDSLVKPSIIISDKNIVFETAHIGDGFKIFRTDSIEILRQIQDMNGRSQVAIPINRFQYPDFKLGFNINDSIKWIAPVDMKLFYPDSGTTNYFADYSIVIKSGYHSFYDTTLIQVKKTKIDSLDLGIPFINTVYEFLPDDIALLKGVSILIKADSSYNSKQWGVYKLIGSNKISFISSNYDSIKNGFFFRSNSLGKYIIAQDTVPPVLEISSPAENKTYRKNPTIKFSTHDELSGIATEENIRITIDSLFVLPEWDPEEDTIVAKIDNKLDIGEHELVVEIKDLAGNFTTKKIIFSIK